MKGHRLVSAMLLAPSLFAAALYTYQDLGDLGTSGVLPYAVNDRGWVTGMAAVPAADPRFPDLVAFLYRPGIGMERISERNSIGFDINNAGVIVGGLTDGGFVRAPDGQTTILVNSRTEGLNEAGQIAGTRNFRAALHTPENGFVDLGTLGGPQSSAIKINESGQVVGWSQLLGKSGLTGHAFLYTPGVGMADLGVADGFDASSALGMNDLGHVVGVMVGTCCYPHAFLWTPEGGMQDLGDFGYESYAWAINNRGWIVGDATNGAFVGTAFVYRPGHGMVDLNDLVDDFGGRLREAMDINERDQIVGRAVVDGAFRGFLLTPVPEPATWAILGFGLPILFLMRCNSRRRGRSGPERSPFHM